MFVDFCVKHFIESRCEEEGSWISTRFPLAANDLHPASSASDRRWRTIEGPLYDQSTLALVLAYDLWVEQRLGDSVTSCPLQFSRTRAAEIFVFRNVP